MHNSKVQMKNSVLLSWGVAVSLFLWLLSITAPSNINFIHFINFSAILFGGGVGYHALSELIQCPCDDSNISHWSEIRKLLCLVFIGYILIGIAIIGGIALENSLGWMLIFIGYLGGMWWSLHFLICMKIPIRKLLIQNKNKFVS